MQQTMTSLRSSRERKSGGFNKSGGEILGNYFKLINTEKKENQGESSYEHCPSAMFFVYVDSDVIAVAPPPPIFFSNAERLRTER